ncbi:MAG: DUF5612 domain-containing protein [Candidatus Hydrothermarchaeota archaeon]
MVSLSIKCKPSVEVLKSLMDIIEEVNVKTIYFDKSLAYPIRIEIEGEFEWMIKELERNEAVESIRVGKSFDQVYGKRVLVYGWGAQISQVVLGAVTEADRHNIRGERISIDTIPVIGDALREAIFSTSDLPRASILVLACAVLDRELENAIKKLKEETDIPIIALNSIGGGKELADLIVTDPVQAGVMAVMAVADTALFDIKKIRKKKF